MFSAANMLSADFMMLSNNILSDVFW
jgi:hypothetical protein